MECADPELIHVGWVFFVAAISGVVGIGIGAFITIVARHGLEIEIKDAD